MLNCLGAFVVAIAVALVISPLVFKVLRKLKTGQNILEYVDNHKSKQGTLTMGGLIFVLAMWVAFIFFAGNYVLASLTLIITACYSLLGFLDDYIKIRLKHNEGLKPYQKIIGQVGIASIVAVFVYFFSTLGGNVMLSYTNISFNISYFIIPFLIIFFIAVTNSVNLTDGLDGLAGYNSLIVILTLGIIAVVKHFALVEDTGIYSMASEYINIAVVCFAMTGALMVFLLFNCHPAKIFMGDTGSLALGGFIASVSAFLQEPLLLLTLGITFVTSSVSDIIQVSYYKLTKQRIFLMAPFHHHLERVGLKETKIVGIYTFVTLMISIITILIYIYKGLII